jgi:hypothetical protein
MKGVTKSITPVIWASRSAEYLYCELLGCDGGLKMEAVSSSATLVTTYKITRRHNPEDENWQNQFYVRSFRLIKSSLKSSKIVPYNDHHHLHASFDILGYNYIQSSLSNIVKNIKVYLSLFLYTFSVRSLLSVLFFLSSFFHLFFYLTSSVSVYLDKWQNCCLWQTGL